MPACKSYFVHTPMLDQSGASLCACSMNHINHTRRKSYFKCEFSQHQYRKWGNLGRFEDHSVATRKDGCQLDGSIGQRKIPRHNRSNNAHGFAKLHSHIIGQCSITLACNLIGKTCVTFKKICSTRHIKTQSVTNWLAHIQGVGHRQIVKVLADFFCKLIEQPTPGQGIHLRPRPFIKSLARSLYRSINIPSICQGNTRKQCAVSWINHIPFLTRNTIHPVIVDKKLIGPFLHLQTPPKLIPVSNTF